MWSRRGVVALVLGVALVSGACATGGGLGSYSTIVPTTMGMWGVGDSFASGGPETVGWVDPLATKLGEPISKMGLGAGTYADVYQFLQAETAIYGFPLEAVVMAGANDLNSQVPAWYMQQQASLASALLVGQGVDVTFVTIPPTSPASSWAIYDAERVAFNNWLINSNMPAIDCSTPLQQGQWINPAYVHTDNSHLSALGYDVYTDCIEAAIAP